MEKVNNIAIGYECCPNGMFNCKHYIKGLDGVTCNYFDSFSCNNHIAKLEELNAEIKFIENYLLESENNTK